MHHSFVEDFKRNRISTTTTRNAWAKAARDGDGDPLHRRREPGAEHRRPPDRRDGPLCPVHRRRDRELDGEVAGQGDGAEGRRAGPAEGEGNRGLGTRPATESGPVHCGRTAPHVALHRPLPVVQDRLLLGAAPSRRGMVWGGAAVGRGGIGAAAVYELHCSSDGAAVRTSVKRPRMELPTVATSPAYQMRTAVANCRLQFGYAVCTASPARVMRRQEPHPCRQARRRVGESVRRGAHRK